MAKWIDNELDIKNKTIDEVNQLIEIKQKDHFKHFQRITRALGSVDVKLQESIDNIKKSNEEDNRSLKKSVILLLFVQFIFTTAIILLLNRG